MGRRGAITASGKRTVVVRRAGRVLLAAYIGSLVQFAILQAISQGECGGAGLGAFSCSSGLDFDTRFYWYFGAFLIPPAITLVALLWLRAGVFTSLLASTTTYIVAYYMMIGLTRSFQSVGGSYDQTLASWFAAELVVDGLVVPLVLLALTFWYWFGWGRHSISR